MNKNKLILAIIWWVLLALILFVAFNLKSSWPTKNWPTTSWTFDIWILWENVSSPSLIAENFKSLYPQYSNALINIEVFSNYDDYSLALISSMFLLFLMISALMYFMYASLIVEFAEFANSLAKYLP